ncbi:MAG: hypothetical protein ACXIU5_07765 [Halomonadaceae bacterium]|jgi:hypothetical protein|uniref:hypothetical protein n=1 Tax=Halomonas sp. MCCC 1A11062 TaxID=2733485 RepID=UPI001F22A481|nr:hypothetical protein [Halomonas sp. MCCC 1A11062]MCE8039567.1 hypothetical protein [Halomonas sp. MCCC 1A11062]
MNRDRLQRGLVVAEMLLLALPVSAFCLVFGLGLLLTVGFPWGMQEVAIILFVFVGTLGIAGLWCVAVAFLLRRESSLWWWRAASAGAGLTLVSLVLVGLLTLGWEPAEWVIIVALGIFASPLLIPFLHLRYLCHPQRAAPLT